MSEFDVEKARENAAKKYPDETTAGIILRNRLVQACDEIEALRAKLAEAEKQRDGFAQDARLCHNAWLACATTLGERQKKTRHDQAVLRAIAREALQATESETSHLKFKVGDKCERKPDVTGRSPLFWNWCEIIAAGPMPGYISGSTEAPAYHAKFYLDLGKSVKDMWYSVEEFERNFQYDGDWHNPETGARLTPLQRSVQSALRLITGLCAIFTWLSGIRSATESETGNPVGA